MRELASIRKDINSVDSAIRELFLLRMSLAHEVAETKAQSDDKMANTPGPGGPISPAAASRRNGGTASPLLRVRKEEALPRRGN